MEFLKTNIKINNHDSQDHSKMDGTQLWLYWENYSRAKFFLKWLSCGFECHYFGVSIQKRLPHTKNGLLQFGLVRVPMVQKVFGNLLYILSSLRLWSEIWARRRNDLIGLNQEKVISLLPLVSSPLLGWWKQVDKTADGFCILVEFSGLVFSIFLSKCGTTSQNILKGEIIAQTWTVFYHLL